jgi:hypothetical protein
MQAMYFQLSARRNEQANRSIRGFLTDPPLHYRPYKPMPYAIDGWDQSANQ